MLVANQARQARLAHAQSNGSVLHLPLATSNHRAPSAWPRNHSWLISPPSARRRCGRAHTGSSAKTPTRFAGLTDAPRPSALSLGALCLALSVWSFRPAIFWGDPCFAGSLSEAKRSPTSHTLDAALGCQLRGWPRFDPRQPPIRGVAPVGRFRGWPRFDPEAAPVAPGACQWPNVFTPATRFVPLWGATSGGGPDSTLVGTRFGGWHQLGSRPLALSGWRSLAGAIWLALSG